VSRPELVAELWRLQGSHAGFTAGGHAWSAATEPPAEQCFWHVDGRCVAWAARDGGRVEALVHPEHDRLAADALDAFPAEALWLPSGQEALRAAAARRGFAPDADGPWFAVLVRSLDDVEACEAPAGFRLRAVEVPAEAAERVRVHRAAWEPSRFTAESYARVAASPLYRSSLDRVAEAADGSLAASALAWLDPENRVGELEPVGTDPRFARRGLARALCLDALRALAAAGAERAVVCPRGDDAYPLPRRLYESIGFRPSSEIRRFVRT
jgi:ribosomal protein S18 acetylase RimI-like enzyme